MPFKPKIYIKDESFDPFYSQFNRAFYIRSRLLPYALPLLTLVLMVTQVLIPLVSFKTQDTLPKPVSNSALGVATGFKDFAFKELEPDVLGVTSTIQSEIPKYYYISIPKLKIEDAMVATQPEDLSPDEALGHYIGSSYPGESGNTFIYGHSVLPFFYNPDNYKTIFSTLDKLEKGDEINIRYKNTVYKYTVEGKRELKPAEVEPLALIKPKYLNQKTLVLMTCSPPGTKLKRLLIDAVMTTSVL